MGKESTCQCKRRKKHRFHPCIKKTSGGGNGTPLQYSCLGNPVDRGAWWATVHGAIKSQTQPSMRALKMPSNPKFRISWEALSHFRISFSWSRGRSTHPRSGQIIYCLPHRAVGSGGTESGYPHACLSSGRGNPDAHIGAAEGTTLTSLQPLTLGWATLLFIGENFPGLWLSLRGFSFTSVLLGHRWKWH